MKKTLLYCCLLLTVCFSSCFKDTCKSVRQVYRPVYKTLSQIREGIKSDSAKPVVITGKIYLYKNYIFLNEPGNGIHVFDNSDPSHPKNISFINIPGNVDLAVKDNYLYADSYCDLVVFDITNPGKAVTKEFKNNVFPNSSWYYTYSASANPDDVLVPVDYIQVDTLMDCETYNNIVYYANDNTIAPNPSQAYFASVPSSKGIGGSTARFTVLNNYLYAVDYTTIYSFSLSNAADPQLLNNTNIVSEVGGSIETIYPFENNLFIGSTNGMFIYSVAGGTPAFTGNFGHFVACDPVIADNDHAFVTLSSGRACQGFSNELEILDIATDITNPTLISTYQLTNPRGLSKDGDLLFICDGQSGLKIFDAADVNNLILKQTINISDPNDVITFNQIALVIATDGLYQYNYSNINDIKLLSKISLN